MSELVEWLFSTESWPWFPSATTSSWCHQNHLSFLHLPVAVLLLFVLFSWCVIYVPSGKPLFLFLFFHFFIFSLFLDTLPIVPRFRNICHWARFPISLFGFFHFHNRKKSKLRTWILMRVPVENGRKSVLVRLRCADLKSRHHNQIVGVTVTPSPSLV